MDGAEWIAHSIQAGQCIGTGRELDVPSGNGCEFGPSWLHFDFPKKNSKEKSWCDFSILIGLDHRCVHCRLTLLLTQPRKREKTLSFRNWRPNLDENNIALDFQSKIRALLRANSATNAPALQNILIQAGIHHGTLKSRNLQFNLSAQLQKLRYCQRPLKQNLLAELCDCKFDNFIVANCDYGGPGQAIVFSSEPISANCSIARTALQAIVNIFSDMFHVERVTVVFRNFSGWIRKLSPVVFGNFCVRANWIWQLDRCLRKPFRVHSETVFGHLYSETFPDGFGNFSGWIRKLFRVDSESFPDGFGNLYSVPSLSTERYFVVRRRTV